MTAGRHGTSIKRMQQDVAPRETIKQILSEVFNLLEQYSPSWYNDVLRERMQSAVSQSNYHEPSRPS